MTMTRLLFESGSHWVTETIVLTKLLCLTLKKRLFWSGVRFEGMTGSNILMITDDPLLYAD
jgi:hypothetical protein